MSQTLDKCAARSVANGSSPCGRGEFLCSNTIANLVFRFWECTIYLIIFQNSNSGYYLHQKFTCSEFFNDCINEAHWYCFSVQCWSFHSMSWNRTITAGSTCKCFAIQLRFRMPFGWFHSYDWCFGFDTGNSKFGGISLNWIVALKRISIMHCWPFYKCNAEVVICGGGWMGGSRNISAQLETSTKHDCTKWTYVICVISIWYGN